ncbi:MAG: glycosyltransferase family 2 protein, partial [Thermodesulfobacteriota bacterium]
MGNPKVVIVIVTWNKKNFVLNILNSLGKLDYDNFEIIVVDNASTDGTVDSVKEEYPDTYLIVNEHNLGGTGGFNTGINYVLNTEKHFDYLWLLDNDADIETNTLTEIIEVMEKDSSVGLAGSRIVDPENKDITIELGSKFRWDTIDVTPFKRNTKNNPKNLVAEVDYVAVCSAVARVEALKKVGPMDERHFLFWDDMDWGLYFKEKGYKVVAVNGSIAYHPSFTERRRGKITDYYYGIRNPLLVYSKHTKMFQRTKIFFNFFRRLLKIILLLRFTNCK